MGKDVGLLLVDTLLLVLARARCVVAGVQGWWCPISTHFTVQRVFIQGFRRSAKTSTAMKSFKKQWRGGTCANVADKDLQASHSHDHDVCSFAAVLKDGTPSIMPIYDIHVFNKKKKRKKLLTQNTAPI